MDNNFTNRYLTGDIDHQKITKETLQKIKLLSKKIEIQPDPIHFSLMYEVLINQDKEFIAEINQLITNGIYTHKTAQILFTSLWTKIIQSHIPYNEFSQIVEELLNDINGWLDKSSTNNSTLAKKINFAEKNTNSSNPLIYIKNEILPDLKTIQNENIELQSHVNQIASEVDTLKKELNKAHTLARTDHLTNLPNKRGFDEFLEQALENKEQDLTLITFDVDFFKHINDEFGHLIGDSVLKYLASIFTNEIKGRDLIARTGGEEFILILKNTDLNDAEILANKIRIKVENSNLRIKKNNQKISLTISAGVAKYKLGETMEELIDRSDKALYSSKNTGRNKVTTENSL